MDKFTRMIIGAKKADADSIRELKNYIYEESGVANKALRALEKAGITEYAYGHAMEFLNTEYQSIKFPQAVAKRDTEDLVKQALVLNKFLKSPTRYVKGARAAKEAQLKGIKFLNDIGYNIPTDKERLARISRILGNDGLKFTGTVRYELMEAIDSTYDSQLTDDEVQMMIDRYYTGEITYDRVVQDLRSAK
jgi:hypothetical protein